MVVNQLSVCGNEYFKGPSKVSLYTHQRGHNIWKLGCKIRRDENCKRNVRDKDLIFWGQGGHIGKNKAAKSRE